jgi:hypothetical protein
MLYRLIFELSIFFLLSEFVKRYIFKKELSPEDKRFLQHTNPIFLYSILLLMGIGLIWSITADFGLRDYDIFAHTLSATAFYILAADRFYIRHKYGPKDWQYVEKTRLGFISIILLTAIFIGLALF